MIFCKRDDLVTVTHLGDPIEVKSFLSVLKKILSGGDVEKLTLSALQPLSNKQVVSMINEKHTYRKLGLSTLKHLVFYILATYKFLNFLY